VANGFPAIDPSPLPPIPANGAGLRCFVLVPADDPLPGNPGFAQTIIQRRWDICINWLEASTGINIRAFPQITYLTMPFARAQVEDVWDGKFMT
jgi:hypothetical protein